MATKEQLLEEAKRRYPVGTVFIPSHCKDDVNSKCTVAPGDNIHWGSDNMIVLSFCNHNKNGHSLTELIYYTNCGWAKILSVPIINIDDYSLY